MTANRYRIHRPRSSLERTFDRLAGRAATATGRPWAFAAALGVLAIWVASGPVFGFSDTWQLIINTGTTIVTFLMVFLIQHAQNKDARAVQLKLDAIIAASSSVSNRLINLEDLTDDELSHIHGEFERLAKSSPELGAEDN